MTITTKESSRKMKLAPTSTADGVEKVEHCFVVMSVQMFFAKSAFGVITLVPNLKDLLMAIAGPALFVTITP